jgi:hypothetical protein
MGGEGARMARPAVSEVPMQQDDFEVAFCDLCGTSVPAADLANGAAVKTQDKVIGGCCLVGLRAARPDVLGSHAAPRAAAGESRLMVVAIVLLAALAAATIFLDQRLAKAETSWQGQHSQLAQKQLSDSEVLQGIAIGMDGAARRADLDAFAQGLATLDGVVQQGDERARQDRDLMRQELAALRQELRTAQAATIDYRPLFDDLRQQLQRQAVALTELRTAPPAAVVPRDAGVPVVPPADAVDTGGLPAALAEQVQKLQSSDPAIRFEAVDELVRSKNVDVLPHLLPVANDPDSFVRRVTMDGLAGFKRPEAVEALLVGLGDSDDNVRDTAWRSLREVTGQKFAFDAFNPSKEVRARALQRWQEWWDKNKATFGS